MTRTAGTDSFTDLVLHVLAHVRAPGPADLYDPRYVGWADGVTPAPLRDALHADAVLIAGRLTAADAVALQGWPELHRDGSFARTRLLALAEVAPRDVASPAALAGLQHCDRAVVELVHAQLGLLAPWFEGVHAQVIAPAIARVEADVAAALAEAIAIAPGLADEHIELAWALGARGRALTQRIVVGAPAPWNGIDAATTAVLALHEHAVRRAADEEYARAEWSALVFVARATKRAGQALRRAHTDWLATLDLSGLLAELIAKGVIDIPLAAALSDAPGQRAKVLAAR